MDSHAVDSIVLPVEGSHAVDTLNNTEELGSFRLLQSNKFVVVSRYMGGIYAHIREYNQDQYTGKVYPTKKGVSLSPTVFATLLLNSADIDEKVCELSTDKSFEYRVHLGKGVYCTVTSGYYFVNIRRYFVVEGRLQPTKNGICLKKAEWNCLRDNFEAIKNTTPELKEAVPCFIQTDHCNQEGAMACAICNPFGLGIGYF